MVDDAVSWNVDDLDEFGAGEFKSPTRCHVFRVACDPQWIEIELFRQWHKKADGSGCVMISAMLRMNAIADVASVPLDMRCRTDSQPDAAEFLFRFTMNHAEVVCGYVVDRMERKLSEFQFELRVAEDTGNNGHGEGGHLRLDEFERPKVVEMENTLGCIVRCGDDERGDFLLLH